jgi:Sulfotransferase family
MTLSEKNRYLFIAVPKTGSSTINRFLVDNDKTSIKNTLISANGVSIHTDTHINYRETVAIIGNRINDYATFAFLRDPYEKLFSYYRYSIRPKEKWAKYGFKAKLVRNFSSLIGFKIWALTFPFKPSVDFILDEKGDIGVKYLGRTEYLQSDFTEISKLENFDFLELTGNMKWMRATKPMDLSHHLSVPWFKKLVDRRLKKDLEVYNRIRDKMYIRS